MKLELNENFDDKYLQMQCGESEIGTIASNFIGVYCYVHFIIGTLVLVVTLFCTNVKN